MISHDLAVVKYVADTIGVMYLGKLVELGPAQRVYEHTAHPYTRALIDAIPEPDVARARAKPEGHIRGELPSALNPPSGCRFRTRCPFAQDICAEEEPPLRPFGDRPPRRLPLPAADARRAAPRRPGAGRGRADRPRRGVAAASATAAAGPRGSRAGRRRRS